MPQIGWNCVFSGEHKSFKECFECSQTDSHCEFTPEMFYLLNKGAGGHKSDFSNPSVTAILIGCLKRAVLKNREDYFTSPRSAWFLLRGNMVHSIFEDTLMKDGWKEVYLTRELTLPDKRVVALGGKVDKVVIQKGLIRDYKTTARLPTKNKNAYDTHGLQLNAYRWIWWPIFHADKLRLQYIDMRGTKQVKIDCIDIDEIHGILSDKAFAYVTAMESPDLPIAKFDEKDWKCRYCDVSELCKIRGGKKESAKETRSTDGRERLSTRVNRRKAAGS